jgi:hypothetical protein
MERKKGKKQKRKKGKKEKRKKGKEVLEIEASLMTE